MTVRTRIAPSPTGDPHVGTAYMALFNWAFARQAGGEFLLRIEDTDQARSSRQSEANILTALRWLGIDWDEGPDVGGPHGPYRQSERTALYNEQLQRLLDDGHAFHCFCGKERLDEVRAAQQARKETTRYDGHCLTLTAEAVRARIDAGESYVVRLKVPDSGACVFTDRLRGEISIPFEQVDMQVLMKADGLPTYHFAVVVDDHHMGITHVVRGEEWINSVPKHVLLYEYLGWPQPEFVHLPLLRNADQSKLSKRRNPTSITYYRDLGFLPEALCNYLALMGWSLPSEEEIFSLQTFVDQFDVDRVKVRGPVFDLDKLRWLNGQYLRQLSHDEFGQRVAQWMLNKDRLERLIPLVHERTETLADLLPQVDYLLGARRSLGPADFELKGLSAEQVPAIVHHTLRALEGLSSWDRDGLLACCQHYAKAMDIKFRDFLAPLYIAIAGRTIALPLFDSWLFLGPDLSRARLREALEVLAVSGKGMKKLDRAFDGLPTFDTPGLPA